MTTSQRAWVGNFLLGFVVGAFLPGVSLAVLLTLFVFDSGQSGLIWSAFLLGILVGTAFSASVAFFLKGKLEFGKMKLKREETKALKQKTLDEEQQKRDEEAKALMPAVP